MSLPWSCGMGGCGACAVRRISGDVVMQEPNSSERPPSAAGDTFDPG
ncbi:MAG: 2Fe-2S iron-sulfur cluster binding domain-containing protein [Deltaproteobacteria bacterium]|nr:2Fe-2S iron-sulfur cluster binding domain-containing protein [Deltaproteobacteria bacterium]